MVRLRWVSALRPHQLTSRTVIVGLLLLAIAAWSGGQQLKSKSTTSEPSKAAFDQEGSVHLPAASSY